MADRKSQKDIENFLLDVEAKSVNGLNLSQTMAYDYLLDYVELGENGINSSLEGERLFVLCVEVLNDYLKNYKPNETSRLNLFQLRGVK
jgi:hypothetical protein